MTGHPRRDGQPTHVRAPRMERPQVKRTDMPFYGRAGAMGACRSCEQRPKIKVCPIPDCGVVIGDRHWLCRPHWMRQPRSMRLHGNRYTSFWAGDERYDRFIATAIAFEEAAGPPLPPEIHADIYTEPLPPEPGEPPDGTPPPP